jgi:hypothetical protein
MVCVIDVLMRVVDGRRVMEQLEGLYTSCLTPDQVGLSAYPGDLANQKLLILRYFGCFAFVLVDSSSKQPAASKRGA